MSDDDLLAAFEECSLPAAQWNHRAHVRIAFLYASHHNLCCAVERMRAGINKYNSAIHTPETIVRGYHETITQAFMRLVFAAALHTGQHTSSDTFCDAHPELLDRHVLKHYYSQERLMTWEAKRVFVEPDVRPLPSVNEG